MNTLRMFEKPQWLLKSQPKEINYGQIIVNIIIFFINRKMLRKTKKIYLNLFDIDKNHRNIY